MNSAAEMARIAKGLAQRPITENERAWVAFLRLLSRDSDPVPNLACINLLQRAMQSDRRKSAG